MKATLRRSGRILFAGCPLASSSQWRDGVLVGRVQDRLLEESGIRHGRADSSARTVNRASQHDRYWFGKNCAEPVRQGLTECFVSHGRDQRAVNGAPVDPLPPVPWVCRQR